jgi:deoxyribonuclease-1-like protein
MGLLFGRKRPSKNTSITTSIPFFRFFGPSLSVAGIAFAGFMLVTGRVDLSVLDALMSATGASVTSTQAGDEFNPNLQAVNLQGLGQKSNELIRIATFNIQVFGKKKSSDPTVMATLAKVMSQFDVIAIQEVRGGDATPIRVLIDLIRSSGGRYAATVSEPIGRTSQTESYAFVWDESRIQLIPRSAYVVQDPADRIHREPMVASFETRVGSADGRKPFRFTLVNVHTSPSEVAASAQQNEMNVLDDVFVRVREYDYQTSKEEDCILLGDLNVDTAGLRELGQIPGIETVAGDIKTNTRRSKTYDHILMDRMVTREYTGRFGVLDFQRDFNMTEEQAILVSDHQPLWAEFSAYEMPRFAPIASGSQTLR